MSSKRDYYEVLNVSRTCTEQELKSAYRRLAVKYHPDKNPGDASAEEKFKEAAEAYSVLSDAEQRRRYDRFGHAGVSSSAGAGNWGAPGFGGIEDILGDLFGFGDVFGGARGGRRSTAQRGADLRYDLEISLEEAAQGMTAQLRIPRLETCDTCKGSGAKAGTQPESCSTCSGSGQVRYQQGFFSVARTCHVCRGAGRVIKDPCETCKGAGRVEREKQMEVKIPAGVETGSRLRVSGEGESGMQGGAPGDLYVVIHVAEHDQFERQGSNLYEAVPITFAQAALGADIMVKTLDGEEKLKIPTGTQTGTVFRLRGKGMPALGGRGKGDLFVSVTVMTPTSLTREQRKLLEQLAEVESKDLEDKGLVDKVRDIFGRFCLEDLMTLFSRRLRTAFSLCALVLVLSLTANAQYDVEKWKDFDFRNKAIDQAQVQDLELFQLKFLRGLVFGRHGRIFKDAEIKSFLEEQPWYKPNPEFNNSMLNETERRNLDVIRIAEAAKHDTIQPGDMRYWRDRAIPARKLGKHSGAEWKVLTAEVEAIHGKRFDDEPWLQQYFEERYWYSPNEKYDAKKLSAIERKSLAVLSGAQKKQRRVALLPGDMELFENRRISEQMLQGLSLHELRLLRNEIYARHGRMFRADWLQQYFYTQPWYNPSENFKDEDLSGNDKLNVETIVRYENRIHEELSTKPITRALLEGLFIEDASQMRQEIYARHGKVFKEPWLQKYFSSFAWYKADPDFTEASLTEVEKKNIATIAAYEKRAVTAMSTIEG